MSEPYADLECLACHHRGTKVIDSRCTQAYVRRRRECLRCHHRFTTRELHETEAVLRSQLHSRLSTIEDAIAKLRDDLSLQ